MVRRTIITYLNTEHNPNSAEHKMAIYAFLLSIEFWEDTNYADKYVMFLISDAKYIVSEISVVA